MPMSSWRTVPARRKSGLRAAAGVPRSLAASAGYSRSQSIEIAQGALLADVGMMLVPEKIRLKRGKLTESELFTIMSSGMAHVSGATMAAYVVNAQVAGVRPVVDFGFEIQQLEDAVRRRESLLHAGVEIVARVELKVRGFVPQNTAGIFSFMLSWPAD